MRPSTNCFLPAILLISLVSCMSLLPQAISAQKPAPNVLRVLTFGDSITQGYLAGSDFRHPYTIELTEQLKRHYADSNIYVDVTDGGIGRSGVLDGMPGQLTQMMYNATSAGLTYDWVIIMAGINDMFRNKTAAAVFPVLKEMYNGVIASGSKVLALPPMETSLQLRFEPNREGQRRLLTRMIRRYVSQQQAAGSSDVYVLDLHPWIPNQAMSEEDRARFWSDGTHPSALGYDLIGLRVFLALVQYMKPGLQVSASNGL